MISTVNLTETCMLDSACADGGWVCHNTRITSVLACVQDVCALLQCDIFSRFFVGPADD